MKILAVILAVIAAVLLVAEFIHNEYQMMNRVKQKVKFSAQDMAMEFIWAGILVIVMVGTVSGLEETDESPLNILLYYMCYAISMIVIIFSIKNHNRYQWEVRFKDDYIQRIYDNRRFVYEEIQLVCISSMDRLGNYVLNIYIDNNRYCLNVSPKEYEQLKRKLDGEVLRASEQLDNSSNIGDKILSGIWITFVLGFVVFMFLWITDIIMGKLPEIILIVFIVTAGILVFISYSRNNKAEKEVLKMIQGKSKKVDQCLRK